jgi:hypothetical protein
LDALEALPDNTLCDGPCTGFDDLRHVVDASINLKNTQDADASNIKSFAEGALNVFLTMLGTIFAYLSVKRKS